jgi:hypothetical protein
MIALLFGAATLTADTIKDNSKDPYCEDMKNQHKSFIIQYAGLRDIDSTNAKIYYRIADNGLKQYRKFCFVDNK